MFGQMNLYDAAKISGQNLATRDLPYEQFKAEIAKFNDPYRFLVAAWYVAAGGHQDMAEAAVRELLRSSPRSWFLPAAVALALGSGIGIAIGRMTKR